MAVYNYPAPRAPKYRKPLSVENCLPQARLLVNHTEGRTSLGPVKPGDRMLIVTHPDQDVYVREAVTQVLMEAGAEQVDFKYAHELTGDEPQTFSVVDGWKEVEMLATGAVTAAAKQEEVGIPPALRRYLDEHPEYNALRWAESGGRHRQRQIREHGPKYRGLWMHHNWESFLSSGNSTPSEVIAEIERRTIEPLGRASEVRITDPQGTHLEYSLTSDEACRWRNDALMTGHLLFDPLQATVQEMSPWLPASVPPIFHNISGVLAATSCHRGYFPRMELFFERGCLVQVRGGGKYGDGIRELMERHQDVHWPGWPDKGFFWFIDCALCTQPKAYRRTSDMFNSYLKLPNNPEKWRAGVFHFGFGSRRHGPESVKYMKEHNLPNGHIHVHNYFATFEVKLRGTNYWHKIVDKGWLTALSDPEVRAIAYKYGDADQILSYDWIPPLPGINCEGDYREDYAPDPIAYLMKRMEEGKPI